MLEKQCDWELAAFDAVRLQGGRPAAQTLARSVTVAPSGHRQTRSRFPIRFHKLNKENLSWRFFLCAAQCSHVLFSMLILIIHTAHVYTGL